MGELREELWDAFCRNCELSFDVWINVSEYNIPFCAHDDLLCPACLAYCPGPKPKENLS